MRQKPTSPPCLTQVPPISQNQQGPRELGTTSSTSKPKRSRFAWTLTALLFLLIQRFSAVVQAQDYILHRIDLKQFVVMNGMNDWGMVFGYHDSPDGTTARPGRGFVYDHEGMIGIPKTVHSLDEWIPTPPGYIGSSILGINNNFQAVGYFSDSTGGRIGFFLDLMTEEWQLLPRPLWSAFSYGIRINDDGDVVILSQNTVSSPTRFQVDVVNISTGFLIPIQSYSDVRRVWDLNNYGQVMVSLMDHSNTIIDYLAQTRTPIPSSYSLTSLNDSGVGAVSYTVPVSFGRTESRVGRLYQGILETLSNFNSNASDINNSGDVLARVNLSITSTTSVYTNESGWKRVNDAVKLAANTLEWQFWTNLNTKSKNVARISNRIDGACWMAGSATLTKTTGSGRRAVTTTETRWYLMVPVLP